MKFAIKKDFPFSMMFLQDNIDYSKLENKIDIFDTKEKAEYNNMLKLRNFYKKRYKKYNKKLNKILKKYPHLGV